MQVQTGEQLNKVYFEFVAFRRRVQIVDRVIDLPSFHSLDITKRLTCDPTHPHPDIICAEFRCTISQLFGERAFSILEYPVLDEYFIVTRTLYNLYPCIWLFLCS